MQQPINYTGYTANNSDLTCQDGELDLVVNLINEDGAMRPIMPPTKSLTLQQAEAVVFIHATPQGKNYILSRPQPDGTLQLLTLPESTAVQSTQTAQPIGNVPDVISADAVGNIVMLATSAGLRYLPWREGAYRLLDARPPFVNIDFGMYKVGKVGDSDIYDWPQGAMPKTAGASGSGAWASRVAGASKSDIAAATQTVYSVLNRIVAEQVTAKNRFHQPFFVRYAYRLFDGSYSWHSAPILMMPTTIQPAVSVSPVESTADIGTAPTGFVKARIGLDLPVFTLRRRILPDGIDKLADWKDIIAAIDVFISAPIYTYDQSAELTGRGLQSRADILLGIYNWNPEEITPRNPDYYNRQPASAFIGHYCNTNDTRYVDHFEQINSNTDPCTIAAIARHPDFDRSLLDCHTFYKYAEISFSDIKSSDSLTEITPLSDSLANLTTRQTLTDDYRSHYNLQAKHVYAYNSRINLAGVSLESALPFSLRSSMQYTQTDDTEPAVKAKLAVWTTINGVKCKSLRDVEINPAELTCGGTQSVPRYLFYPDAAAYKIQLKFADSNTVYTFNLSPHPFLNGAYYYQGQLKADCTVSPNLQVSTAPEEEGDVTIAPVRLSSKLYTSDINNPFIFPVTGINTVGSGEILHVVSAAKALSQGQFGQFPLYAFTTEGVWALSVNDTGSYSARQPITRDVCNNPGGILQIDSAVLFTSDRGIMLLTGSQTECISDSLNGPLAALARKLPYIDRLFGRIGVQSFNDFAPAAFDRFLAGCGMLYDYTHQRILVFNPDYLCAFAFSLKSRQWGMFLSDVKAGINSYPEALALDSAGNVCNFSVADTTAKVGALLLTRPLKLGSPYVMKTVRGMQQWGRLGHYDAGCMLYGSRDLEHWRHISNSATVQLHGISGSPYNYFSILVLANLQSHQSLTAATLDIHPHPYRHNLGNQ